MFRYLSAIAIFALGVSVGVADDPKPKANGNPKADPDRIVEIMLQRFDTNKDGLISKAEAQGRLAKNFNRLDTNKDGFLDKDELKVAARFYVDVGQLLKGKGKGKGKSSPAPRGLPEFDSLDKNADGRLTRDEVKGTPIEKLFNEIDTNKDGTIDPQEYTAYREKKQ